MAFYRTLEERSAGGTFLVAYEPAVYGLVLGQIQDRRKFYSEQNNGHQLTQRQNRLKRLEVLADALFEHLQHAPNGTIRFPLAKVQTSVKRKSVKNDMPAVFSKIKIEKSAGGIATYHFSVAYKKEGNREYGYLIHRVKN